MIDRLPLAVRPLVALALAVGLSLVTVAPAAASVGYATFTPPAAAPGTAVAVLIDGTNCPITQEKPDTVTMVLTGPDPAADGTGPTHDVVLFAAGDAGRYRFTVPQLPAGRYDVDVACFADGGLEGMVTNMNGGEGGFRVLPPSPATNAAPPSPARGGSADGSVLAALLAAAAGLGLVVTRKKRLAGR